MTNLMRGPSGHIVTQWDAPVGVATPEDTEESITAVILRCQSDILRYHAEIDDLADKIAETPFDYALWAQVYARRASITANLARIELQREVIAFLRTEREFNRITRP